MRKCEEFSNRVEILTIPSHYKSGLTACYLSLPLLETRYHLDPIS